MSPHVHASGNLTVTGPITFAPDPEDEACAICDRQRTQAAYVEQWRAKYPLQVYGPWWQCPLCAKIIQVAMLEDAITVHQLDHGDDWRAYEAAASAKQAAE
jgi:hypothetical protein